MPETPEPEGTVPAHEDKSRATASETQSWHQTMEPGAAARYVNTWLKTIAGGFIIEAYDPQGDETEQKHLLETMIDGRTHVKLTDTVRAGPTKTGP